MIVEKFEAEGKKYVEFCVGNEKKTAEIAPFEIVESIEEDNEPKLNFNVKLPDKVKVDEKINFSGFVEAPDETGEYEFQIGMSTPGYSWTAPVAGKFEVVKKDDDDDDEQEILKVDDIKSIVKEKFSKDAVNRLDFADSKYKEAQRKDVGNVLRNTKINKLKYKLPWTDCDDFSWALMGVLHANPYTPEWQPTAGQAIFVIWVWWKDNDKTYAHALNCMVTKDDIKMIEPQNDKVFDVPDKWNLITMIG